MVIQAYLGIKFEFVFIVTVYGVSGSSGGGVAFKFWHVDLFFLSILSLACLLVLLVILYLFFSYVFIYMYRKLEKKTDGDNE